MARTLIDRRDNRRLVMGQSFGLRQGFDPISQFLSLLSTQRDCSAGEDRPDDAVRMRRAAHTPGAPANPAHLFRPVHPDAPTYPPAGDGTAGIVRSNADRSYQSHPNSEVQRSAA